MSIQIVSNTVTGIININEGNGREMAVVKVMPSLVSSFTIVNENSFSVSLEQISSSHSSVSSIEEKGKGKGEVFLPVVYLLKRYRECSRTEKLACTRVPVKEISVYFSKCKNGIVAWLVEEHSIRFIWSFS